ncbi:MAG: SBBP repeat-containing protein [candidate division WOR-3 bacterium]
MIRSNHWLLNLFITLTLLSVSLFGQNIERTASETNKHRAPVLFPNKWFYKELPGEGEQHFRGPVTLKDSLLSHIRKFGKRSEERGQRLTKNPPLPLSGQVDTAWVRRYNSIISGNDYSYAIAIDNAGNIYVAGSGGPPMDYITIKYDSTGLERWVARYDGVGNGDDYVTAIAVDQEGNVYVTGYSWGGTSYDYATVKYDSAGAKQWVASYTGPGNGDDGATAIAVDQKGNVFVTGYSYGAGTSYDYTTIKYNSLGVEQWAVRYAGPGNSKDYATAITVDQYGAIYVTGYSYGSGTSYDYATVKYNWAGVEQWVARYDGPNNNIDYATAILINHTNAVYVTGYSWSSGTSYDYATVKYTLDGEEQWVARYNGPGNGDDEATAIAVDQEDNVYVTGYSYGSGSFYDYATVKYNSDGEQLWVARYNGAGNRDDEARAIAVDQEGNVYVTGRSAGSNTIEYATVKYNSEGVEQWVAGYNGPGRGNDEAAAIVVDQDKNVYVTGRSWGEASYDFATVKYNSEGSDQWSARYDGPGNGDDEATAITVDQEGNVYVTGYSYGSGSYYDYATVKYNSAGVEEWVARYNGTGNGDDFARAIAIDKEGNVYVTGYSYGLGTSNDYTTVKYNSDGVEQWVARYTGAENQESIDEATAIAVDPDGNVYVTGHSWGGNSYDDYVTVKYNSDGQQLWVARYNGAWNRNDCATAIALDREGNVYVTGNTWRNSSYDYGTVKYNSNGQQLWVRRYNGPGNRDDVATAIALDQNKNVYVTGYSYGAGTQEDYATVKYDSLGTQQWVARYNGPGSGIDAALAIAVDREGNVYVTGYDYDSLTDYDYATVKYNTAGVRQWVARYAGPANWDDEANGIAIDENGNVYVTGYSFGSGPDDYATVKYNPDGVEEWVARYNGPGDLDEEANAIAVDQSGNVYVTGYSGLSGVYYDYVTIKYVQSPLGLRGTNAHRANELRLFPNPARSAIHLQLPSLNLKEVKIYDVSGNLVKTVSLSKGENEGTVSLDGMKPGAYFVQIGKERAKFILSR